MATSAKKTNTEWTQSLANKTGTPGQASSVTKASTSPATKAASSNVAVYGSGKHVEKLACSITERSSRTATCTWTFNTKYKYVDHYEVTWRYYTPHNKQWNSASTTNVTSKFSTYSIPANSDRAKCTVRPIQKSKYKNKSIPKKEKWTASASTSAYAYIGEQQNYPDVPSRYEMKVEGNTAVCTVSNYKVDGTKITFRIVIDGKDIFASPTANVKYGQASTTKITLKPGHSYYMQCMATRNGLNSAWSDWTESKPTAPGQVTGVTAETLPTTEQDTTYRVQISWKQAQNVSDPQNDKYEIAYTKKPEYFDTSPNDVQKVDVENSNVIPTKFIVVPPSEGTWFFRVRGVNSSGNGAWSSPNASASVGQKPEAPTTWSYTSSVKIGDPIVFNWTHNSADGSKQSAARINIKINGVLQDPITLTTEKTYSYSTDELEDGATVTWSVQTKGSHPEYSDASVEREARAFIEPTVSVNINSQSSNVITTIPFTFPSGTIQAGDSDVELYTELEPFIPVDSFVVSMSIESIPASMADLNLSAELAEENCTLKVRYNNPTENDVVLSEAVTLEIKIRYNLLPDPETMNYMVRSYPLSVLIDSGPDSQKLISADFTIKSKETYVVADDTGRWSYVNVGDSIYTKRIDNPDANEIEFDLTPGDIDLATGVTYSATAVAYMSSGLIATGTFDFDVAFTDDEEFIPDAGVEIDLNTLTATIDPFCDDEFGAPIKKGATLSVYRLNFDGTFTELATDIPLGELQTVIDPHPTLDYARYRIVAKSDKSGKISYYDLPPEPVNVDCIVMQWADEWATLDEETGDIIGDMLILPLNVDVSDSNNMDVSLIEYIGRENPVSYYGTQKGYSSNWKCEIRKDDADSVYSIRRLARYAGDVYVREPNGSGYWANVKVQYSINHNTPTIPVSFTVTRVEGGA